LRQGPHRGVGVVGRLFGHQFVDGLGGWHTPGVGRKHINLPTPAAPLIFQNSSLTSASVPINCAFKPCSRLPDDQPAFGLLAAEIDHIDTGSAHLPYGLAFLAEGLVRHGDRAAALAAVREHWTQPLPPASIFGMRNCTALTGTVLLAENKLDEGQSSLQQAIRIAQAQQAKSLELRAATSLARLWGEQGRRGEARDLLAPGLWLVHRGLRHRRSERGKGSARPVGMSR
jgi:hypothetical protein